jgi:signal transduction histidine kinase
MLPIILAAIALHPPATLRFLAIPVVTFLVLTAANPLAARALGQRSLRARLTILLLATAACGVTVGAMAFALVAREPVLLGTVLGSIFFVVFLSLAATVNAALDADRRITIARLETAAVQLRRNLALVNQVRWFQEKALSRALHGPVQTAIAAAAFKLDGALKTGDVTPDLIERLRRDVAREIDVLADVTRYSVPLDVGLQSIAATWDGVCRIEMTVDPEVSALVANDAPLRACTIAIAVESVSNAIRHGKSASVDLRMSADSAARELILEMETCSPTQAEVRPSGPTGLGTRQLDECATSWALEIRPEGQRLRANLPSRFLSA